MIITSWNIRGLNSRGKQRYLNERLKKEKPSIMIVQETKISTVKMREILNRNRSRYEMMGQDAIGSAGGLIIIWNLEEIQFSNWMSFPRILSGTTSIVGTTEEVIITGVYGPRIQSEKENFLQNLKALRCLIPGKQWIVGGDFNLIKTSGEKRGGTRRVDKVMEQFGDLIRDQNLIDIQTINGSHTWNNRRGGANQIASRLDRFLISEQIMLKDVFIEATILPVAGSDHWPIKLEIDLKQSPPNKPFRFEAFWLRNEGLMEKLEEWWRTSDQRGKNKMHTFQLKLKEMKNKIKKWNKEEFGNIIEEKKRLEQRMEELQQMDILEGIQEERIKEEGMTLNQLEERRKQEEILWKQKSRVQWLREGERNTKFFHKVMVQHRQRNRIFSIKNQEGQRVLQHEEIEKVLVNHFKDILREPQANRSDAIAKISREIPNVVTRDQNLALMRKITMEEVEDIVRNMKRNKAPGPDGYTVEFFQAGWKFLAAEVLEVVEEARINQRIWPRINSTLLTFIPKTNQADQANGFRPIALCNVIYKIVASVVAQRLKLILSSIISPEKTGFVEGRQILDGLVVAQEVGELGPKHDLHSEFLYYVEWSANNNIQCNKRPQTRGPLSPFLFIIAAEGLGRYFKKELRERKIQGLRLWGNQTTVTHQQFVDDIMIYCKATLKEVKRIKKILEIFMEGSGMEVNNDKSITFFFNTVEPVKNHLTRVMGYQKGDLPTKYLGTMLDSSTLKIGNWKNILEKIMKRLENWTFRALNLAARVVLLKATIQEIPIYPLSVMAAPEGICNKLVEIYRKFLWGGPKQQKKWALCSWNSLTRPKEKGGLGLRDPWTSNQVLAAKLRWRWLQGGADLWE
eukprot:PITA_01856